jgi:peptidoglycan/LPS O-acetylase OafA/YrhL
MAVTGQPAVQAVPAHRGVGQIPPPRITGHQDGLDGLRAIAALAVLLLHVTSETGFAFSGSPASWVAFRGDVGVPVFFTLSGLLLFRPWAVCAFGSGDGPDVRSYLIRRVLRIVPVYWVVVAIAIVTLNWQHARSAGTWAQYLLFAQVYNPHPWWSGTGIPGLAQVWSLSVEVSFYALLPVIGALLVLVARRGAPVAAVRARRMLIGIAILGAVSFAFLALLYYPTQNLWLSATLPRSLCWFAPGMAMAVMTAWANSNDPSAVQARALCSGVASSALACWLIAALVLALACTPLAGPETLGNPSLWQYEAKLVLYTLIPVALVAPVAFQAGGANRLTAVLGNAVMRFLGKVSYGVFLWQFLAIYGLLDVLGLKDAFHGGHYSTADSALLLLATAVITVAMATLGYYLIERPAQRLYRFYRRRPQPGGRGADPVPAALGRPSSGAA